MNLNDQAKKRERERADGVWRRENRQTKQTNKKYSWTIMSTISSEKWTAIVIVAHKYNIFFHYISLSYSIALSLSLFPAHIHPSNVFREVLLSSHFNLNSGHKKVYFYIGVLHWHVLHQSKCTIHRGLMRMKKQTHFKCILIKTHPI